MTHALHRHDVIVVGARCAGAATARLLAARGYDVVLVDRATMPSDTLSTHGLARGGVVQLSRWGLLDRLVADGAPPMHTVAFATPAARRAARKGPSGRRLPPRTPTRTGSTRCWWRRPAPLVPTSVSGSRVERVLRDDIRPRDRRRGAAGAARRRPLLAPARRRCRRPALDHGSALGARTLQLLPHGGHPVLRLRRRQSTGAPSSSTSVRARFAGVFPTHDGQACVWLSRPDELYGAVRAPRAVTGPGLGHEMLTEVAPGLGERVRAGRITSPVRGCVDPPNYVRQALGDGWSLVGDAGYHRDPITGHGMTDAFRDAELLADALDHTLRGDAPEAVALAAYQTARDQALADIFRLTRELARFPRPDRFVELADRARRGPRS